MPTSSEQTHHDQARACGAIGEVVVNLCGMTERIEGECADSAIPVLRGSRLQNPCQSRQIRTGAGEKQHFSARLLHKSNWIVGIASGETG